MSGSSLLFYFLHQAFSYGILLFSAFSCRIKSAILKYVYQAVSFLSAEEPDDICFDGLNFFDAVTDMLCRLLCRVSGICGLSLISL